MQMRQFSRTPSPQLRSPMSSARRTRLASRTPSPRHFGYEQKLMKSASTPVGGYATPRQRSFSPTAKGAYLQKEQFPPLLQGLRSRGLSSASTDSPKSAVYDEQFANCFIMPFPQAQEMETPPSQSQLPEALVATQMPDMPTAQMPLLEVSQPEALPVQAGLVQVSSCPASKGPRWADMESDEELEANSGGGLCEEATMEEEQCFSVGSIGHPTDCNAPCKYSLKAKGCKDGTKCDRCHLCKWTKLKTPLPVAQYVPRSRKKRSKANAAN